MVMFVSAMLCAASILTGVNISNNFFAAIVISFGIGASSMQLPCVFYPLAINGSCRSDVVCSGGL